MLHLTPLQPPSACCAAAAAVAAVSSPLLLLLLLPLLLLLLLLLPLQRAGESSSEVVLMREACYRCVAICAQGGKAVRCGRKWGMGVLLLLLCDARGDETSAIMHR
jgi:hypothetical protein